MEKLLVDILKKFKKTTIRDLESKQYDYLILDIDIKEEIKDIVEYIIENNINIDCYFFINGKFESKKLYIQASGEKKQILNILKKIHNFFRIKYNKNISFKKSSKHSVFLEGVNIIVNLLNNKNNLSYKILQLNMIKKILKKDILIAFNENLLSVYKFEIENEYKKL